MGVDEENPSLESRLIGSDSVDSEGDDCFNRDQELSFDNLFEECRKPLTEAASSCEVNEIEIEQKSVVQLK